MAGGVKNAIERGESSEQIKKSFLNAGYSSQDVDNVLKKTQKLPLREIETAPSKHLNVQKDKSFLEKMFPKKEKPTAELLANINKNISASQTKISEIKPISKIPIKNIPVKDISLNNSPAKKSDQIKKFIPLIILVVSLLLIISSAALLGIFWDRLFG